MDRGAWQATVLGVAKRWARLSDSHFHFQIEKGETAQLCLTLCDSIDCGPPAPLSMEFSRQEYWSGLPFSSPGDLSDPGIEPTSLMSPALAGGFVTTSATWEAQYAFVFYI